MIEIKDTFLAAEIKNIDIESACANLLVEESGTDEITVTAVYNEEQVRKYNCERKDGVLEICHEWKNGTHKDSVADTIKIVLPTGAVFENLSLELGAGDAKFLNSTTKYTKASLVIGAGNLSMDALNAAGKVEIEAGAGNVSICGIDAKSVDAECGAGKLNIYGKVNGDINIECGVGKVKLDLEEEETAYNYQVSCGIGSVRINGSKLGGLFASENSIHNAGAKGTMNLSCGVGSIHVITK